jgi:hypothetical protein
MLFTFSIFLLHVFSSHVILRPLPKELLLFVIVLDGFLFLMEGLHLTRSNLDRSSGRMYNRCRKCKAARKKQLYKTPACPLWTDLIPASAAPFNPHWRSYPMGFLSQDMNYISQGGTNL